MVKLEVLGKKWVWEILRALESGPKGFNEIMKAIGPAGPAPTRQPASEMAFSRVALVTAMAETKTVSSRTLSDRLEDLQREGIVSREVTSAKPPRSVYTFTEKGNEVLVLGKKLSKL